jgi:hypothetical protein
VRRTRRLAWPHVLAALVIAVGVLGAPVGPAAPAPVLAATPDLTIVGKARYDVQPDEQRVRVIVDLTMRNRLKDTSTRRFYFDEAFLAVPATASSFSLDWKGSGNPRVSVNRRTDDATILRLRFGARLFSGKSATYRLTFYLKDPGGQATRELRVGEALVSFPVWAYASDETPGASTTVVFPPGYDVVVEAGSIPEPEIDEQGRTIFRSGTLEKPLEFFAYLVADKPTEFVETALAPTVLGEPAEVLIRAWPDDPAWAERVSGLVRRSANASACPGPTTSRSSWRKPSVERPAATRGCSIRPAGAWRSRTTPATWWSCTRPHMPGSTARSWLIAGPTRPSPRTTPPRWPRTWT